MSESQMTEAESNGLELVADLETLKTEIAKAETKLEKHTAKLLTLADDGSLPAAKLASLQIKAESDQAAAEREIKISNERYQNALKPVNTLRRELDTENRDRDFQARQANKILGEAIAQRKDVIDAAQLLTPLFRYARNSGAIVGLNLGGWVQALAESIDEDAASELYTQQTPLHQPIESEALKLLDRYRFEAPAPAPVKSVSAPLPDDTTPAQPEVKTETRVESEYTLRPTPERYEANQKLTAAEERLDFG